MSIIFKKNQLMFLLIVAMFMLALLQPNFAFAEAGNLDNSPITVGLCNIFELAGGNIGKAIAIFAIVAVGFGFFTGKFSIALVIGITLGIGILFGAPKIIAALTGENVVDCATVSAGDDVVCPFNISFSGIAMDNINSNNKSFTLTSNSMDLARISCKAASTGQNDIRPQLTPLTSSSTLRAATVTSFITSIIGNSLSSSVIDNSSSVFLTTSSMTADINFTVTTSSYCQGIKAALTYDSTSACSGGKIIAVSSTGGSSPTTGALCAPSATPGLGTSPFSTSNVTHFGNFQSGHGGGDLIIKPGFLNDTRTFAIGSRQITATCASGVWNLTTSSNAAANVATATTTAPVPMSATGATAVTINFTP